MKKKLKALKRRWRKLLPNDRKFFQYTGFVTACYIVLGIVRPTLSPYILWCGVIVYLRILTVCERRDASYRHFKKGQERQDRLDWFKIKELQFDNAELEFHNKRLNSDYKKLKYDYNQLKKSINPLKKKKK